MSWIGTLVLGNIVGFPHPERLVVLFLLLWVALVGVAIIVIAFGVDARSSTYGVFVASAGFTTLGGLVRERGFLLSLALVLAMALLVAWLSSRERLSIWIDALIVAAAVALLAGPVMAGASSIAIYGSSTLERPEPITVTLDVTPNIWLVVTDGYPSSATLEADLGVDPTDQLVSNLQEEGFAVPANTWSAYASTRLAMSSILDMDYIATDWKENPATIGHLYSKIAGKNQVIEILKWNGYHLHMIESGWSGGGCGREFDICTPAPLNDGALNVLIHDSLLTNLPWASPGFHFTLGTRSTMASLLEIADSEVSSDVPRFIFAHLLAPHPPLFLNEECDVVVEERRKGFFYPYPGVAAAERDRLFKSQIACVDGFLLDLAARVSPDDVVIFVSDHGPSRRAQTSRAPSDWPDAAFRERLGTLVAIRTPMDCTLPEPYMTVNLMRSVLSCLSETKLSMVGPRLFPGPGFELEPDRVEQLMDRPAG